MRIRTMLFALMFLALPLSLRADTYTTFQLVNVTFNGVPNLPFPYPNALGTITIDTTTSEATSSSIFYGGHTFNNVDATWEVAEAWSIQVSDVTGDHIDFLIDTDTLQNYVGAMYGTAPLCTFQNYVCNNFIGGITFSSPSHLYGMESGYLQFASSYSTDPDPTDPAPVPEPSSLALLGTGLIGAAMATVRRRLMI